MKLKIVILFYTLLLLLQAGILHAQVTVSTLVVPPYQSRIADYASNPQLMLIALTNSGGSPVDVQLSAKITGDNGISAWVKPGYRSPSPIHILAGQTVTLNGQDIAFLFDINKIEYTGISRADMTRGIGLLEGNYTLCIRALQYRTLEQISPDQTGCASFRIADLEPPRILAPYNKQKIDSKLPQAFPISWTTPPGSSPTTQYKVKIVEIIAPRNPNDAIQSSRPLIEETVTGNMLVYGPAHPALVQGREYAMVVQAQDPTLKSKFRNQGVSEVSTFIYGQQAAGPDINLNGPMQIKMAQLPAPDCGCKNETNSKIAYAIQINDNVRIGDGSFEMRVNSIHSGNIADGYQGTGTVSLPAIGAVPGLKLRVNFAGLFANAEKRMYAGMVRGMVKGNAPSFMPKTDNPDLSGLTLTSDQIVEIDQYLKNTQQQLVSGATNAMNALGFELPLGVAKDAATLAITEVYFNERQGWFNASAAIALPDAGPGQHLALSGRDFCMTSTEFCKEGVMSLAQDFNIAPLRLKLLAAQENSTGTHIRFDANGFKSLGIVADYAFPPNTLVRAGQQEALTARLSGVTADGWGNWIATVAMDPFNIAGVSDFKFSIAPNKAVIYDHSDSRNATQGIDGASMPNTISFGPNQQLNFSSDWKGFFIPEILVELPSAIKNKNNTAPVFAATNFVFDTDRGEFSGSAGVSDLLTLDDGSLDGWYFSIDRIQVNFFKNAFTNGLMNGKLMFPFCGEKQAGVANERNEVAYDCTLSKPQGSNLAFAFRVLLKKDLDFKAFWAKGSLMESSQVLITAGGGQSFKAEATLHGALSIVTDIDGLPDIALGHLGFTNMKISSSGTVFSPGQFTAGIGAANPNANVFNTVQSEGLLAYNEAKGPSAYTESDAVGSSLYAEAGSQESLMGFNFTIRDFQPYFADGNIGLTIVTHMELVNGASFIPKADLQFSVFAKPQNGIRKFWKGVGGKIETVELGVDANLAGMSISGFIKYFDASAGSIKDRGFAGGITLGLPVATIGVKGLFGTRKQAGREPFQFFYLDGQVEFQSGIPMFPGTSLYGFAGGAYYNMERKNNVNLFEKAQNVVNQPSIDDDGSDKYATMKSFSGVEYTPISGNVTSSIGFMAGIYFGLQSRAVLDGQVSLEMGFKNGSFNQLSLNGRVSLLNDMSSSFESRFANAMGQGEMSTMVEFENGVLKFFDVSVNVKLKYPVQKPMITASGAMSFRINGPKGDIPGGWYLKIGTPWHVPEPGPIQIQLTTPLFKAGAQSYFQVGNMKIDDIPPVPDWIQNIINHGNQKAASEESSQMNSIDVQRTEKVRGPVSTEGMITGLSVGFDANPQFLIFYADLKAGLGADLSLKYYPSGACNNSGGAGWYAKGQAFIGAEASCGVRVNIFGIKKSIEFVSAGLAAEVTAGLPDPLYAKGRIGGYFSVLNGLIAKNFKIAFEIGEVCENMVSNPEELNLIEETFPKEGETITVLDRPAVSFNYSLTNDFIVPLEYEDSDGMPYTVYQLFRFSKGHVSTSLLGPGMQLNSDNFVLSGRNNNNLNAYRGGKDVYSIQAMDNVGMLQPEKEYTYTIDARVSSYKYNMVGNANLPKSVLEGMRNNTANFELVSTDGKVYVDSRAVKFKTSKGPKTILVDNVIETYPYHRHANMPYTGLSGAAGTVGYISLRIGQPGLPSYFDCPLRDNEAQVKIRFVLLESGGNINTIERDVRVSADGKRWEFDAPALMPNTTYAAKIYFKRIQMAQGGKVDDAGATTLIAKKTLDLGEEGSAEISGRQLVTNALSLSAGDHELFAWYFKTGKYDTYKTKYNSMRLEKAVIQGQEIKRGQKEVNLSKLQWDANESTKTLKNEAYVEYYYSLDEPFHKIDVGSYVKYFGNAGWKKVFPRLDVLPQIADNRFVSNRDIEWESMLSRSNMDPEGNHMSQADETRIWNDFVKDAFGADKNLKIEYTSWDGINNGSYGISPIRVGATTTYLKLSSLLPSNMYDINFQNNTFGSSPSESSTSLNGQSGSGTGSSTTQRFVNMVSIGKLNQVNTAGMMSNMLIAQPSVKITYAMTGGVSYGKGVLETGNNMLQRAINFKKDQGYPTDIFNSLQAIGNAMDKAQNVMQINKIQVKPALGASGPGVIAQPQMQGVQR